MKYNLRRIDREVFESKELIEIYDELEDLISMQRRDFDLANKNVNVLNSREINDYCTAIMIKRRRLSELAKRIEDNNIMLKEYYSTLVNVVRLDLIGEELD